MLPIKIVGTGLYVPGEPITNLDLKRLSGLEFDAEKLENKIGIFSRHMAKYNDVEESTADFATKAAMAAIANAGVDADEIGLFIVGTDTPE